MTEQEFPLAAVIVAGRAAGSDGDRIAEMVQAARDAGADPIVVAVPRGWRAPSRTRVAHVAPGAPPISAVRAGMAQLSNTSARFALLWPLAASAPDVVSLLALVDDVKRERADVTAFAGDDLASGPVIIARDAWLELMTIGEQGILAFATRRGLRLVTR